MSSNVTLAVGGSRMSSVTAIAQPVPTVGPDPRTTDLAVTWAALPRGRAMRSVLPWATEPKALYWDLS